jgi:hypothetical protein
MKKKEKIELLKKSLERYNTIVNTITSYHRHKNPIP